MFIVRLVTSGTFLVIKSSTPVDWIDYMKVWANEEFVQKAGHKPVKSSSLS